ncbi:snurportin-1 [Manduca sexta]|uniref:Snurportin-1 n=1 Tax=Manduca sexta TaxID=7130 RepID=A0A921Z6W5_MANSE|nr:snurportin-1 [Manduca sexta]KAG6452354.1 hypothetical protein O3G_MSEX007610 [Manduca sexta]
MDEVLKKFGNVMVASETCDESKSIFEDLYKNWGKFRNQEERRKQILEKQKSDRNSNYDNIRGILESVNSEDANNIFKTNKIHYRPNIFVAGFHKIPLTYKNVLMFSEWMIEKPEDFNDNWYVVPCPKGVRMLVVASKGLTKCYTKYGQYRFEFRTALPGGNPRDTRCNHCCVLDCFYYEKGNTMFVLDLLAWNIQPMCDGETDFRHFWLQTHLAEIDELKRITKTNNVIFSLLPKIPCTPDSFNEFMMKYPAFPNNNPSLDGFLFYHKRAHYVSGETPLVGWLFPFMVPEVMGEDVKISQAYLIQKPIDYTNQAEFIQNFNRKHAKKQRKIGCAMDTSEMVKNENDDSVDQSISSNKKGGKTEENSKMEAEVIDEHKDQIACSLQSYT